MLKQPLPNHKTFQSTLPRRERPNKLRPIRCSNPNFNPRSREGSDGQASGILWFFLPFQSTLPRRERLYHNCYTNQHHQFQSTLPRRERQRTIILCIQSRRFQSTLPRRERRYSGHFPEPKNYFNPRSREGSDHQKSHISFQILIFI